jgi:starch synthase (maltosyl-transferring)
VDVAEEPKIGRIPIRMLSPQQPEDRWPAKAFAGELVPFGATVFKEGHDLLGVELLLTAPDGTQSIHRMHEGAPGLDGFETEAVLNAVGMWRFQVRAWVDDWATWLHNAELKIPAGVDVDLMLTIGSNLLAAALERAPGNAELLRASKVLSSDKATALRKLDAMREAALSAQIERNPLASLVTTSETHSLRVERERAGVGSWYEFFPRSEGAKRKKDGDWTSGTFRSAMRRLPAIARLGFDVVYLPPIHPIGTSYRKGANNSLTPEPGEPGSPWAIGSAEGGHDAIHPELGTEADFVAFLAAAKRNKLEVALDFALQCSPDHPWVHEQQEWFTRLPDHSIANAENPPKKYQDIYPLNFDNDPIGIRTEILRILKYWIGLGVRIFRVDNPHTKPLQFWEWLLGQVAAEHPDVVFLAEAFTRPAMLQALVQVGFQQSYTYFTWRNTKAELADYLTELSHDTSAWLRPNLFVNTPDILTEFLQFGGRPAFAIRAGIAATASPSWGLNAGYELYENVARAGTEEYVDNEKYQYRPRDFAAAEREGRSLAPLLGLLNRIRAEHPALRQLRNLTVHRSDDDAILVYSKQLAGRYTASGEPDAIIVVVNVDPHSVRETTVHLDPSAFWVDDDSFQVTDLLTGAQFTWGADNYVRLDAFNHPMHILQVEYRKET